MERRFTPRPHSSNRLSGSKIQITNNRINNGESIMKRTPLVDSIFSFKTWADLGPGTLEFQDVTLKIPVGEFPAGHQFEAALLAESGSLLAFRSFINEEEKVYAYNCSLTLGTQIPESELNAAASADDDCGDPNCQVHHTIH
jgi:hypothetical protein